MARDETEVLPEGTQLIVDQKRNDDGTHSITGANLLFPDGTRRDVDPEDYLCGGLLSALTEATDSDKVH